MPALRQEREKWDCVNANLSMSAATKYGLRFLSPKVRLLFIVIATSLFAHVSSLKVSIIIFVVSALILLWGKKLVLRKVFLFILSVNTIYMIFGNWLFSPNNQTDSLNLFIFRINDHGLLYGVIGALKRNAMIVLSFAWLSTIDSLYDIYISVNFFKQYNKTYIIFLKWIQNLQSDFTLLYYSMQLKGFDLKSKNIVKKVNQLKILIGAVLNGFFSKIGKLAFNGESHFNYIETNVQGTIDVKNLSVSYDADKLPVLSDINFSIGQGEIVFITGENNSGKTTLLKAISGYIPKIEGYISEGDVLISGISLNSDISLKKINSMLRYIVENPSDAIIGLTVKQELLSQTDNESVIQEYSKLLNIEHLWNQDTCSLSGGEKMRLVLAGVLCSNVKILIIESPLGHLDSDGKKSFFAALKKLVASSKDVTVVISDQNLDFYKEIVTRVIRLDRGTIVSDNQISDVESGPAFPVSTSFKTFYLDDVAVLMKDVNLCIEKRMILSNINLAIKKNQCIAILGENGSGKTTLALTLAKILKPTSGNVDLYNCRMGFVFQDCSKQILENMVEDEILLSMKIDNCDKDVQKQFIQSIKNNFEFNMKSPILDISNSQIHTMEFVSNCYNRDIVLFDEPTNYLDNSNISKFCSFIQRLLDEGKTIIIITHNTNLASLCSRFILMHKSEIALDTFDFQEVLSKQNLLYDEKQCA